MDRKTSLAVVALAFAAFYFLPLYLPEAAYKSSNPIMNGLFMLYDYTCLHVLTCLLPAFFIAGAISALVPKESITTCLGKNVPKRKAYPLSIIGGLLLAVCSCTVLPLFAGIKKRGAGIGPAIAFLYTAPATNILAILFTGSVLGWDLAGSRIILSVTFAVIIGVIMSSLFKEEEGKRVVENAEVKWSWQKILADRMFLFVATLILVLIAGTRLKGAERVATVGFLSILAILQAKFKLTKDERANWLSETYSFLMKIFPLLLLGVFFAGAISALIPENFLSDYVGGNTVQANLMAVLFGVVMYFPTLVEVPMAQMFLGLGMGHGPLLAYLLADPVVSLASLIVIRGLIGTKKTLVYALLITVFCTISGLIYGTFV